MFTLVIGESQFTVTAEDAARFLNTTSPDAPAFFRGVAGRTVITAIGQDARIVGPAMMRWQDTRQMLRDNGYRH